MKKNTSANNVVINGDQYEVEIYLLKDPCATFGLMPISFSSLRYLEITNDLAELGYHGKVGFTNFNDILERLGVLKASKNLPLMYFRLKSLSFKNTDSTYDDIFFLAALTQGQDNKEDEVESSSYYNFEDLYVFKLKTTPVIRNDNNILNYNGISGTVSDIVKRLLRFNSVTSDAFRAVLSPVAGIVEGLDIFRSTSTVKIDGQFIDPSISEEIIESGEPIGSTTNLNVLYDAKISTSLHKAIKQASSYLSYKTTKEIQPLFGLKWYDPGIIKLENDIYNKGQRKFVMFPLLGTINDFLTKLSKGQEFTDKQTKNSSKKYLNNILTEKFSVSQKNTAKTFSNNTIVNYELKRVDISNVLEEKWVGVQCSSGVNCASTKTVKYTELRNVFERLCTSPYTCNLPENNEAITQYNKSSIPDDLAIAYGVNSVMKSFIFDNVMCTFRVKGQPYRKPNRFISINPSEGDKQLDPKSKNKEISEVDGYWYVLSVNHLFIDGNYFNDFECVKLYNLGAIAVNQEAPSLYIPASNEGAGTIEGTISTNNPGTGTTSAPLDSKAPIIKPPSPEIIEQLSASPEKQKKVLEEFLKSNGVGG